MNIEFKELFSQCEQKFEKIITSSNNEVIKLSGISILTYGNKYVDISAISRHYVTKNRFKITVRSIADDSFHIIETTDDHTCIRINDQWFYENIKASELQKFDNIPLTVNNKEYLGVITNIENLGPWNDYVYDLEVGDKSHIFYANNILIHNSQFIDISPIVNEHLKLYNIENKNILALDQTQLDHLIEEIDTFVESDVNNYIKDLVNKECYSTQGHNLHYSREYVASQAMFFKKKHYIVHQIKKDDKNVNIFKYSGVSCKKAEIPIDMKFFLKNIFEETCNKNWKEYDYRKYIDMAYEEFLKKTYEDISLYKSYNTEKAVTGFMESEKRTGAHARAANIYNQLLDDLKIGNKYEKINLGDQLRYCYINESNKYGINVIAFKEYVPEEFKKIFTINYDLMFKKIFLSSLKGYISIMHFSDYSPSNKALCDINDL